jgi:hypothetical protein
MITFTPAMRAKERTTSTRSASFTLKLMMGTGLAGAGTVGRHHDDSRRSVAGQRRNSEQQDGGKGELG